MHVSADDITGAHILRAAGRALVIITEQSAAGRAAAYQMLTRTERAALLCALGGGSHLFGWLEAESMTADDVPEPLRWEAFRRVRVS